MRNDAAEQNCEAHQCGERNSNGITQPSGAATPRNGDAHGARLRSEGSLLLSDVPSVHAKMAKYALLTAARAEVPDHAAHAEGSDTTPIQNAPVSPCEPLCARLGDGVAGVPAFTRESGREPFVPEVLKAVRPMCWKVGMTAFSALLRLFRGRKRKQDKGLASKPPLCPLTSARSADSFTVVGTGVLSARKWRQ